MTGPGRAAGALRRALLAGLCLLVAGWVAAWAIPLPARLSAAPSPVVQYADGSVAHVLLAADEQWRIPVHPREVDPEYLAALVRIEDARFWWHPGVDPLAVGRAAVQDLAAGHVVSGASTLTMQVARLADPRPRTLSSKGVEALRALQLEARLSKEEVLEQYLAFLPFGRNVEGLGAASWWYFGHGPGSLTAAEIATLLAVPQDPVHRYPSADNEERLRAARDAIARRLWAESAPETLATVLATPVPARITPPPRAAPHASRWLLARSTGAEPVHSTIDRGVQRLVDRTLGARQEALGRAGIRDAAVVVVEHATGEVRALLGGVDFDAGTPGAQIPAFDVPRSPGSTLKPLLYAAAIDEGLVLPDTVVPDVPVTYAGYSPENYDGRYDGMVRLEDALSRSLNVPFVQLLARYGTERFLGRLRSGGAAHLSPAPGHYGLSAIAGGIELTPLEVAGLYAALAQDGAWRPLRVRADAPPRSSLPLVSAEAAWLTRRALRLRDRPDFPDRSLLAREPPRIHWKTGTSYGNRDAWAVGSGRRYTVVVWLGNLDQTSSSALVGAPAAAPILFDLLEGLDDGLEGEDPLPPGFAPVEVCALSGQRPTDACPKTHRVPALASRAPTDRCALHVATDVDAATGERLSGACSAPHVRERRLFVQWPPRVDAYLANREGTPLPPLARDCLAPSRGGAPVIRSPEDGTIVVLMPGVPEDQQEVPLEAVVAGGEEVAWYADGRFVARVGSGERAWWTPTAGTHQLAVMDATGRTTTRRVEVRTQPPLRTASRGPGGGELPVPSRPGLDAAPLQ